MKEAIYFRLSTDAGVLSLLPAERITPVRRDQGAGLPAIVYHVISAPRSRTLAGQTAMVHGRIQVDCWGSDEDQADTVAKAVKSALEGARFSHLGVKVRGIFMLDETEDGDSDADARPFHYRMDFRVHFTPG